MLGFLKNLFGLTNKDEQDNFRGLPNHDTVDSQSSKIINLKISEINLQETEPNFDETGKENPPVSQEPLSAQVKYDGKNYQYPDVSLFGESIQSSLSFFKEHAYGYQLPILWSAIEEDVIIEDVFEFANILIVGTQATGKTNFIHQIIFSLLLKKHPFQVKFVLADIKSIDLGVYGIIENLFLAKLPNQKDPVIKDFNHLVHHLNSLCIEMDNRYELLTNAKVRNITEYNHKFLEKMLEIERGHQFLPSIILIIDDLGAYTYTKNGTLFEKLIRIVSEGYKVGIFTIIGTSQISGFSLPGDLLSMFGHRAIFRLNSREDYRKFFDTTRIDVTFESGMFLYNDSGKVKNGKTILIPISDIEKLVNFIGSQDSSSQAYLLPEFIDYNAFKEYDFDANVRDPLFEDAAKLIVISQSGSTALLQRRMKLGYNRAGRLMDQLEAAGIVGPNQGSIVREVLIKTDEELLPHFSPSI